MGKIHIGKIIKIIRENKEYTSTYVAEKSNISRTTLNKIENGKTDIKLNTLISLSKTFKIDASILLKIKEIIDREPKNMNPDDIINIITRTNRKRIKIMKYEKTKEKRKN